MSWKFWRKDSEPETRGYHDSFLNALLAQAEGGLAGSPQALASLETCASAYARCMASATITPDNPTTRALSPSILAHLGRDMIRQGGALLVISVEAGQLELLPAGDWDVLGGWHERDWRYTTYVYGPSSTQVMSLPSQAVCHVRYSFDSLRPWISLGPLGWASSTATMAANTERMLANETGRSSGYVIPVPRGPKDRADPNAVNPLDKLRDDLGRAGGGTLITETLMSGWGGGRDSAPARDFNGPARFGADPPDVLATLRSDAGQAVLAACGVPADLFLGGSGSGQSAKAAWQRFLSGSVQPVADLAAEELAKKLDVPGLAFHFDGLLTAGNVQERSASFAKLVQGGMSVEKAASLSGVLAMAPEE